MLCTPVLIFTSGSFNSSFRAPTLWFFNLTVATCHIHCKHFPSLCQFFLMRKQTKHKDPRSLPFSYDTKMAASSYQVYKALVLRAFLRILCQCQNLGKISVVIVKSLHKTTHCCRGTCTYTPRRNIFMTRSRDQRKPKQIPWSFELPWRIV